MLVEDANDDSVSRSLEAYLLWLFGWIMFNNSHRNNIDKVLMSYAREIADAAEDDVPTWMWRNRPFYTGSRPICHHLKSSGKFRS